MGFYDHYVTAMCLPLLGTSVVLALYANARRAVAKLDRPLPDDDDGQFGLPDSSDETALSSWLYVHEHGRHYSARRAVLRGEELVLQGGIGEQSGAQERCLSLAGCTLMPCVPSGVLGLPWRADVMRNHQPGVAEGKASVPVVRLGFRGRADFELWVSRLDTQPGVATERHEARAKKSAKRRKMLLKRLELATSDEGGRHLRKGQDCMERKGHGNEADEVDGVEAALERLGTLAFNRVCIVLFVLYPLVTAKVSQMFQCRQLGFGEAYVDCLRRFASIDFGNATCYPYHQVEALIIRTSIST